MTALRYVYAVCRPFGTALPPALTGVAGDRPRVMEGGGLVAVVGEVPEQDFAEAPLRSHLEDLDWLSGTARGHERVIEALTAVTTPLPMRLATVFRDDEGVRLMLTARDAHFRDVLDRLDGRVEWGVKVYAEPASEPEPATSAVPESRPASGRDYLRLRRQAVRSHEDFLERAERFASRLHTALAATAEDSRLHVTQSGALSTGPGPNVLNAAYLLPRSDSREFMRVLDDVRATETHVRVQLTGPWAGYSFVGDQPAEELMEDGEEGADREGKPGR
ncbi:GvpL/GvpF family gas vesicle protein [Streptomyces sp. NPDC056716]|uniref:GvpL/GvpF family gas vesicle protein n=1 Tax=unclassified Streptomyces TaxID=2593676 RepID=UPI0036B9F0C1